MNGEVIHAGSETNAFAYRLLTGTGGRKQVHIDTRFGFAVKWDGKQLLRIVAHQTALLRHRVEGLCGEFDDRKEGDLVTSDGRDAGDNVDEFTRSWMVEGYDDSTEGLDDKLFTNL